MVLLCIYYALNKLHNYFIVIIHIVSIVLLCNLHRIYSAFTLQRESPQTGLSEVFLSLKMSRLDFQRSSLPLVYVAGLEPTACSPQTHRSTN